MRRAPIVTPAELTHGIPLFVDQLTEMLPGGRHAAIEQAVHDYGDLCQAITELASEQKAAIDTREFGILEYQARQCDRGRGDGKMAGIG